MGKGEKKFLAIFSRNPNIIKNGSIDLIFRKILFILYKCGIGERPVYPSYILSIKSMNSNLFQGTNVSHINWEFFLTIHNFRKVSQREWLKYFEDILCYLQVQEVYWSIENNNRFAFGNHAHLLLNSNGLITDTHLVNYFMSQYKNSREIEYNSSYNSKEIMPEKYSLKYDEENKKIMRILEYRHTQRLLGKDGKVILNDKFVQEYIPFRQVLAKNGRIYCESIKGVKNVSLYTSKFTSKSLQNGYINRNSIKLIA
jgi:hypothetical protein